MSAIDKIVNLKKHPISTRNNYIFDCSKKLHNKSILILDNFLTNEAIKNINNEAKNLKQYAYYCSQSHTILLNKSLAIFGPFTICIIGLIMLSSNILFNIKLIKKILKFKLD